MKGIGSAYWRIVGSVDAMVEKAKAIEQDWMKGIGYARSGGEVVGDEESGSEESGDEATGSEESGDEDAGTEESGDEASGSEESGGEEDVGDEEAVTARCHPGACERRQGSAGVALAIPAASPM